VLQSDTGWAKRAVDEEWEPQLMVDDLLAAFAAAIGRSSDREASGGGGSGGSGGAGAGRLPVVRAYTTQLWPYGDMDYELEGGCASFPDMHLALAGDWAFNGRVEGAWYSGRAAAQAILESGDRCG